jgi:hypothetical protein
MGADAWTICWHLFGRSSSIAFKECAQQMGMKSTSQAENSLVENRYIHGTSNAGAGQSLGL